MNSKRLRSGVIYLLLVVALAAFLYSSLMRRPASLISDATIAQVATLVRNGDVRSIEISGDRILVVAADSNELQARVEEDAGLVKTLANLGVTPEQLAKVDVAVAQPQFWDTWSGVLIALLPLVLLGAFFFFILRQAQGAGNQAFSFGKSRARMFTGDRPTVTFKDVAGNEEAKQELQEVVEFLKEPQKFALAKRAYPSSAFPAPTSSRCSSALAPAACATSSSRLRKTHPASSSWTRSTPLGATAAPGWVAHTTSANRR